MPTNDEFVKFKNYERKIKSPFIIYGDLKAFQCQKIMESKIWKSLTQTNIKNILLAVMDINWYVSMIRLKGLPFKTYLGKDAVSKYCCELMKKHFNKEVVMAKGDNEDFKNSTKC